MSMHAVNATDEALAEVIETWLRVEVPDDQALVGRLANLAMSYRACGATLGETCEWTQHLLRSWLRDPSHGCAHRRLRLVGAQEAS